MSLLDEKLIKFHIIFLKPPIISLMQSDHPQLWMFGGGMWNAKLDVSHCRTLPALLHEKQSKLKICFSPEKNKIFGLFEWGETEAGR